MNYQQADKRVQDTAMRGYSEENAFAGATPAVMGRQQMGDMPQRGATTGEELADAFTRLAERSLFVSEELGKRLAPVLNDAETVKEERKGNDRIYPPMFQNYRFSHNRIEDALDRIDDILRRLEV